MPNKKKKTPAKKKKAKAKGGIKEVKMKAPAIMGRITTTGAPKISGSKGAVVVKHCEYLDDVYGDMKWRCDPNYNIYELNPGLVSSFPWLGNIASGFEQYRWRKLKFSYRTRSSTNAVGSIYMATQKDSADPPFSSKEEMYAYAGMQAGVRWADLGHDCLLGRSDYMKKYFVRTGELKSGQDVQLYDTGNFTFVAVTQNDASYIGDLLVEYEVELFTPKMNVPLVGSSLNFGSAEADAANPFGGITHSEQSGVRNFVKAEGKSIVFDSPGVYQVALKIASDLAFSVATAASPGVKFAEIVQGFGTTTFYDNYYIYIPAALAGITYQLSQGTDVHSWLKVSSAPLDLLNTLTWSVLVQPPPPPEEAKSQAV